MEKLREPKLFTWLVDAADFVAFSPAPVNAQGQGLLSSVAERIFR